jgi:RNA polymerase sigma-70 factor, ECF subfamily
VGPVALGDDVQHPGGSIQVQVQGEEDGRAREARLIQKAREGDVAAFEQLYRANVGRVYALCLRLASDANLAEELTQDVFVRAWQKLGSFRGESAFSSWLYPLTVNVALTERRSRVRRTSRVFGTEDPAAFERPVRIAGPELGFDLERALALLPPGARSVFVLHDVEGYRHGEIAQLTGVAAGTSKAQLHRARRLLREALLS